MVITASEGSEKKCAVPSAPKPKTLTDCVMRNVSAVIPCTFLVRGSDGLLIGKTARRFQSLLCRGPRALHQEWTKIFRENPVVSKSLQKCRTCNIRIFQQLKTKHRPLLHWYSILGEKRYIDFDTEHISRFVPAIDASKKKGSPALVMREAVVNKMHSHLPFFHLALETLFCFIREPCFFV